MKAERTLQITPELEAKWRRLEEILRPLGRVAVAFSGGVDSSLVLKVAHDVLGDGVLALIGDSPSLPRRELREALNLAATIGVRVRVVPTDEVDDPAYAANPAHRCYVCKHHVYGSFRRVAWEEGIPYILDGANADDVGDFRPGRRAARELEIRSPLWEAGLTKADVRALARFLGLPNWDKPAAACLSSRVPYGTPITREVLRRVERAEDALHALGFRQLRVRHHEHVARIEVPTEEFPRVLALREEIVRAVRAAGYTYVTLDLVGFRSGSSNEVLSTQMREAV